MTVAARSWWGEDSIYCTSLIKPCTWTALYLVGVRRTTCEPTTAYHDNREEDWATVIVDVRHYAGEVPRRTSAGAQEDPRGKETVDVCILCRGICKGSVKVGEVRAGGRL